MSTMFGRKNDRRLFVIHIKKLLQPDTSKKQCKADEYSNIQHFPDTPVEGDRRRNLDESYANKLSLQPSSNRRRYRGHTMLSRTAAAALDFIFCESPTARRRQWNS